MKIGLVGETYQESSLPFNAERSINLYAVLDKTGKEVAAMYGTPGLYLFGTAGAGPIRGEYSTANGRAFTVSGSALYEVNSDGTTTSRGSLNTASGTVYMVENGLQLAICDQTYVYIFTYATNAFAAVVTPNYTSAGSITFIDGYFIVNQNSTGKFYISSINDGSTWAALDFATAESSPDFLKRAIQAVGLLWLQGADSTEIWQNTGASAFPFQRISGGKMTVGIYAPATAIEADNTLFWVGSSKEGNGIVYRAQGFTPLRISTTPIELMIRNASDPTNIRAWTYQRDGHLFYVLTGGGLATSLVYDVTTKMWHERAYLAATGAFETHLATCAMKAFDKILVGDKNNGNIYVLDESTYSDNGDVLAAERIYTHLSDEDKMIRYNKLIIGVETGVGLQSGQGSAPVINLQLSKDGARTWSDIFTASIGAVGEYMTEVAFRRLGVAKIMTFKIRITDPVKRVLIGSYLS